MMPAPSTTTTGPGVPLCTPIDIFNAGTGVGIGDPPAIVVIVYCCAEAGIAVKRQKRRVRMGAVISQKTACLKGTCEHRLPRTREDSPDQETRRPGLNLYQVNSSGLLSLPAFLSRYRVFWILRDRPLNAKNAAVQRGPKPIKRHTTNTTQKAQAVCYEIGRAHV